MNLTPEEVRLVVGFLVALALIVALVGAVVLWADRWIK